MRGSALRSERYGIIQWDHPACAGSSWVASVIRERLMADAAKQIGAYEAAHADEEYELARLTGDA
ncbi:hypothetical protein [Actinoplanes sp. NPDC049802]|uniref:hypothetical protein n=1 Tax=Actinoplanes sp. NPDC049802 TaxID=3154742 RepID=UPI0033F221B7